MSSEKTHPATRVHDVVRRPGPGWRQNTITKSIWDHESGMRLHMLGMLRLPNGEIRQANQWPTSQLADGCIRVAGGNRKRGLMIWALVMLKIDGKVKRLREIFGMSK
jgi:hypothetical protein